MKGLRPTTAVAFALVAGALFLSLTINAAETAGRGVDATSGWDVMQPRGRTVEVDFETDEGTWMSVDVSPDGRSVVFDLLGHIYRLPITGGVAECLTQDSGIALNFHPRYSPDGGSIAFISDRGGQNNLWVMDKDGANPRPVFLDPVTRISQPAWVADGSRILAVREFPTYSMHRRSARIWSFPVAQFARQATELVGHVSGLQVYWPSASSDGRFVYYMQSTFAEPLHGVQRRQHIRRLDTRLGADVAITDDESLVAYKADGPTEMAPELSPNGRQLAFVRRIPEARISNQDHTFRGRSALWIRDLATGAERILMDPIEFDLQGAHAGKVDRIVPGYAWSRDGKYIVITSGGKLRRVLLSDGSVATIPFVARVHRLASEQARAKNDQIDRERVAVRAVAWPSVTPDERLALFEAAGRVWRMSLPDGIPEPLVPERKAEYQHMPAVSRDGKFVAYVTLDDDQLGTVWRAPLTGGEPKALSRSRAHYLYPVWTASGEVLVLRARHTATDAVAAGDFGPYDLIALSTSSEERLIVPDAPPVPVDPGPDDWLFRLDYRGLAATQDLLAKGLPHPRPERVLVSFAAGQPDRVWDHLTFEVGSQQMPSNPDETAVSPDGRLVAFQQGAEIFLTPIARNAAEYRRDQPLTWLGTTRPAFVDVENLAADVRQVSSAGGMYPRWRDATTLVYASAKTIHVYDVNKDENRSYEVAVELERRTGSGVIALAGAQLITLDRSRPATEVGTVVVSDRRITCVGVCDTSKADRVIDAHGKTIMPGLVDGHAHYYAAATPAIGRHLPPAELYLAHGVTTTIDPYSPGWFIFPLTEMIESGRLPGPRLYTSAEGTDPQSPSTGPSTYEEVEAFVRRNASLGAIQTKIYLSPRRDQRQMYVEASRAHGLAVTNEGADLLSNIASMLDGSTGFEHPMPYLVLYRDAAQFFGRLHTVYSPTLIVGNPSTWLEDYYQSRSDAWNLAKYRRFMPWKNLVRYVNHLRRPDDEYTFAFLAQFAADMVAAGGETAIGGHGQMWGLDSHFDTWGHSAAVGNIEALRIACQGAASMAGIQDDVGSLTAGKVADLLVLNSSPIEDIRNTIDIAWVMKDGVLYDDETLDEVWPRAVSHPPPPINGTNVFRSDTRDVRYWDRSGAQRN